MQNKSSQKETDIDTEKMPRISHRGFSKYNEDMKTALLERKHTINKYRGENEALKTILTKNKEIISKIVNENETLKKQKVISKEIQKMDFDYLKRINEETDKDLQEIEQIKNEYLKMHGHEFNINNFFGKDIN